MNNTTRRNTFIWLTGRAPRARPVPTLTDASRFTIGRNASGYIAGFGLNSVAFACPPPPLWSMQFTTHTGPQLVVTLAAAPNAVHRLAQRLLLGITYKRMP